MPRLTFLASLVALSSCASATSTQIRPDAVMLRTPDVSRDAIVFRYAGDLWLVDKKGGIARSLSSPAGAETQPKFSPDGKRIAFMAGYDGGSDLYVLAIDGGIPLRVTHHPDRELLCDWDPNGVDLIFSSSQVSGQQRAPKLFRVNAAGGQPTPLAVPYGLHGAIDATGTWLAYCPQSWALNASWKRYQGGLAEDIWLFDLKRNTSKRMTEWPGLDAIPMWNGQQVVFLSDRGPNAKRNLWSYDAQSGAARQLTSFDSDVHYPSVGPDDVVYENSGRLWRYEFASGKNVPVEVSIPTDRPELRARLVDCTPLAGEATPGPTGKRVVVGARGEIFSIPAKDGVTQNLTHSDGVAERFPAWSPDGKWIAYITDASGENELAVRAGDGRPFRWNGAADESSEQILTALGPGYKFRPSWSPDSKVIVFATNDGALHRVRLADGAHDVLDVDPDGQPFGVSWSPDSRWIAYTHRGTRTRLGAIFLFDTQSNTKHEVTSGQFQDTDVAFDREGDWLFFRRSATFEPLYSEMDDSWIYANSANLCAVPLRTDVKSPWAPKNDAEGESESPTGDEQGADGKDASAVKSASGSKGEKSEQRDEPAKPVEIALDGFEQRAILTEAPAGRIGSLQAAKGKLLYLRLPRLGSAEADAPNDDEGNAAGGRSQLVYFDLEKRKEEQILDGVVQFQVCGNGEKVLVRTADAWAFVEPAKDQKIEDKIAIAGLKATIDPRREWNQILTDAGRLVRDYFYQADTHHVDWNAIVARYKSALPDCTSREDVDFLIREMIGELNCGHTYDDPPPGMDEGKPASPVGLLGCDWVLEQGAYKIARIVGGGAYDADARSPLAIPGVGVEAGEFLLAVNDVPVDVSRDVYAAFDGTAGKATWITISRAPRIDGKERRVLVKPIAREGELRYRDWVACNRELVAKASNGRIGYVHVPDTGIHGQTELVRQFMGAFDEDALIVDERWNSGGQIPNRFIELLNRPVTNFWAVRNGEDWTWPPVGHRGPKCMLINEASGSGGDCFPYFFRAAGLGKLIGRRTWGGLVGLSGNPSFIDGSSITVPTFGFYEKDGTWGVEGHGVEPDLEVIDDPALMVEGGDPQLQAAIQHMQQELAHWKFDRPKRPQSPDRSAAGVRPEDQ